jgi:hypothetical protein
LPITRKSLWFLVLPQLWLAWLHHHCGGYTSGSELQLDFVTDGEYSTNVGSRTFF